MNRQAQAHLHSLMWALVLIIIIGLVLDQLVWTLLIGLSAYLVWMIRQTLRLYTWLLNQDKSSSVPESYGLWGDLFDGLYQIQQRNHQTEAQLKALVKRIRSSTNALKDAVIMTNSLGEMEWWNLASGRLLGLREETDHGQLITNLVRDPAFKHYFDAKHYDDALDMVSPINSKTTLRIHITLFGKEDRLIIAQDITRVNQLEQMRRDFVSNVSHEMRTPLTVIHGYLETFNDSQDVPEKWKRPMKAMFDQTRRLDVLVSDLLLLEKYESGTRINDQQTVDVSKLLQMICHDAGILSGEQNHNITLEVKLEAKLKGDENQLRSAFSNLVFNAVKYTSAGGEIQVNAWQDQTGMHVSVKDTGCGFDPVHIPRLTERFYRVDPSRHTQTGGSGLGLAIVKHVLINHQGTLEIKSTRDVGSEFSCHFPLTQLDTNRLSKKSTVV